MFGTNNSMRMKNILIIGLCVLSLQLFGQEPPKNWFTLDPETDQVQGVSADKVLKKLAGKDSKTIVVAVIDSGVDIEHEDLQGKIWINTDEIPGNGIDDDKNGYVDDVYGWNFIGGPNGENVNEDTYELTREYVRLKKKYEGVDEPKKKQKEEFEYWKAVEKDFLARAQQANQQYNFYKNLSENLVRYSTLVKAYLGVERLTLDDIKSINSKDSLVMAAQQLVGTIILNVGEDVDFKAVAEQLQEGTEYFGKEALYRLNADFDPRNIVGDDWENGKETGYGNNDVEGPDASHGTHVAGIIAANRNNDLGIRGVAENVQIMSIRAVPDGDERDKDVANAIRYAVDNGADIINMSFGKDYSYRKHLVEEAIRYAEKKNVLCIHAAGNDGADLDASNNYPSPVVKGKRAKNWLEIGASSWGENENFVGTFSNFGKESVDLFAPGVSIYSTTPDNKYESFNGTSMAAPTTSGVAAIVMSYFPQLSAQQVREILTKSTRTFTGLEVKQPGSGQTVKFSELSRSGGLVNAEKAVDLAIEMTKGLKTKK